MIFAYVRLKHLSVWVGVFTANYFTHVHNKSSSRLLMVDIFLVLVVIFVVDEIDITLRTPVHGSSGDWFVCSCLVGLPIRVGEES